jgi:hypothetical protein
MLNYNGACQAVLITWQLQGGVGVQMSNHLTGEQSLPTNRHSPIHLQLHAES